MPTARDYANPVSIWINDTRQSLEGSMSVDQLLQQLAIVNPAVAVEVNRELVPRATFADTFLKQDDRVEIVTLSGGG